MSYLELRGYQREGVTDILDVLSFLGPGGSVAYALPTGGGKTVVGIELLLHFINTLPKRVHAWITHRKELRDQSGDRMTDAGLLIADMSAFQPHNRRWYTGGVNIISPTIQKWPKMKGRPGVLLVDECHHAPAKTWGRFIQAWRGAGGIVIGLTGTMWRLSKREGFEDFFDDLIHGPDVEWLTDNNWLARPVVVQPSAASILMNKDDVGSHGDYRIRALDHNTQMVLAHDPVMQVWSSEVAHYSPLDPRTLWFVPTVHCADKLSALHDEPSAVLTADTPRGQRESILNGLRSGQLTHLVSVDVLSEGLDIPSVPVIASLRPSQSLAVWLQQCGRGSRPKGEPGVEGGYYLVLDYAKNVLTHGVPDAAREWSLEPRIKMDHKGMEPPYGLCRSPGCGDIALHPSVRYCEFCGAEQYFPCAACHVDRRWTQFVWYNDGSMSTCKHCRNLLRELQTEEAVAHKVVSRSGAHVSYKELAAKFHKPGRFARRS